MPSIILFNAHSLRNKMVKLRNNGLPDCKGGCSDRDVELLCISLQPFYFPLAYVPPDGNIVIVVIQVSECVQRTPNAPLFILGFINHCHL